MPSPRGPVRSCQKCGDDFNTSSTGRTVNCPKCRASAKPVEPEKAWACTNCGGSGTEADGKPCANSRCNKERGLTSADWRERMAEWNDVRASIPFTDRRNG